MPYRAGQGKIMYAVVKRQEEYLQFLEATCELQCVDLLLLTPNERLAFCINLYNLMVKHAFVEIGAPKSKKWQTSKTYRCSGFV